jgi:hypothetical protein
MIADRRSKDHHVGRNKRRRERGTTTTSLDNGRLGAVAVAGCVYVVSHADDIGLNLAVRRSSV